MGKEKILTDTTFQSEVLEAKEPVLVDFWAPWCGPCKMLGPIIESLAEANDGKATIAKINVDENQQVPQKYGIQGIPTMILFKNGQEVQKITGYQAQEKIQSIIDSAL